MLVATGLVMGLCVSETGFDASGINVSGVDAFDIGALAVMGLSVAESEFDGAESTQRVFDKGGVMLVCCVSLFFAGEVFFKLASSLAIVCLAL